METDDLSNEQGQGDDGVKGKETVDDEDEKQSASHNTTVIRSELTPTILRIEHASFTRKNIEKLFSKK